MTSLLLEFTIRTSLIAVGTAAVLFALRIKTASARHAAWSAVVITMLSLPVILAGGVRMSLPVLTPAPTHTAIDMRDAGAKPTAPISPAQDMALPTTDDGSTSPKLSGQESARMDWRAVLVSGYFAGAAILLLRLVVGTLQANKLRRTSVMIAGRLTSEYCATPITVGWFKPALILPRGWTTWSSEQLGVVLTHEREHARRHDPLVQWLALFNRAVFWFHPLAWWLERRLSTLSEEACDAAVIAAGHSPEDYSEYLLEMARSITRSGRRIQIVGLAMPGHGLPQRMGKIFSGLPMTPPSPARVACTVIFCVTSSAIFAAGAPARRIEKAKPDGVVAAPQNAAAQTGIQSPAPAMQIKFEAVSIRPCESGATTGMRGGGTSMRNSVTPGYASWGCVSLVELIDQAYGGGPFPKNSLLNTIRMPPGQRLDAPKRIRGGPSWVESEKFAIEIRLSGDTTNLTGPAHHDAVLTAMAPALRALLEDRFQLKLRKATEERPMYALAIASGGLKMTAVDPNKCYEVTAEQWSKTSRVSLPPAPAGFEGTLPCGYEGYRAEKVNGDGKGNQSIEFTRIPMKELALWLSRSMDRYVLDKTGVDGRFNFKLEYAPDDNTPGDIEIAAIFAEARRQLRPDQVRPEPVKGDGPTIFKALQALGLTLEKTTGPAEYLLIESAQRPTPGGPQRP